MKLLSLAKTNVYIKIALNMKCPFQPVHIVVVNRTMKDEILYPSMENKPSELLNCALIENMCNLFCLLNATDCQTPLSFCCTNPNLDFGEALKLKQNTGVINAFWLGFRQPSCFMVRIRGNDLMEKVQGTSLADSAFLFPLQFHLHT